ncbi:hypothetical protein BGZ98_005933 [Dissophora globulifera]|nr:hypothetical protein BGZ98_005933 [Dissophora globulifera]
MHRGPKRFTSGSHHWNGDFEETAEQQDVIYQSDVRRTFGRPRIALPRRDPYDDEREQGLMQLQIELQENQSKPSREQLLDQSQQQSPPVPNQDSSAMPLTLLPESQQNPQSKETELRIQQSALHPAPFQTTLTPDRTRYLIYLPYAGITKQFYGVLRGMEVAKRLGRTLIIPPISSSSYDKTKQNQPWSKYLDLKTFSQVTDTKVIELHELRDEDLAEYNKLQCRITCGIGSKHSLDLTARGFLRQWRLNATMSPLQLDDGKLNTILSTLESLASEKYICISNAYQIQVEDNLEWKRFGQHLHFTHELEEFVHQFLKKNLVKSQAEIDSVTGKEIRPARFRYLVVHARRGNFSTYCEDNFAGPSIIHCLPSTAQIAERIDLVQERLNPTSDPADALPVFVATNERDPDELRQFANLGWRHLDHTAMGTIDALGIFGPMMVDQVFMAYAETLVGIQMSTFSRIGALRQRDWHGREVEYM